MLRRRDPSKLTTSEHLADAYDALRKQMRQAGLGRSPSEAERGLLADISAHMRRLALDESLDPQLRDAMTGVAQTADWLRDPPEAPASIVDFGVS